MVAKPAAQWTMVFPLVLQAPSVIVTVHPERALVTVPSDVLGLSYESMQLTDPEFFAASNKGLVAIFRTLSPHGVLRLGGNSSELGWWKPTDASEMPPEVRATAERTKGGTNRTPYAITPKAIDNLAGFLKATGWTLIYGLPLGAGTPEGDAAEAAYVARRVGDRLEYFQIGNEPDLYTSGENGNRPKGWGFPQYADEWTAIAHAVSKRVPKAQFGGPDVAGSSTWITEFGTAMKPRLGARLATLSGHYYAMGPAGGKNITIARLLSPQPSIGGNVDRIEAVARPLGLTYRMTEGNTCYRGGQAGMSDAFASALWSGDYILGLAAHGASGVNLHGGGGAQIAASLGNQLPGARNDADRERAKLGSFYTPIAGSRAAGFTARPVFYGMILAGRFAGATMLETEVAADGANVTAYAARKDGRTLVALFNKDLTRDVAVDLRGLPNGKAMAWRLAAPALNATEGTTLGGESVENGKLDRPRTERIDPSQIALPHGSAVLVTL